MKYYPASARTVFERPRLFGQPYIVGMRREALRAPAVGVPDTRTDALPEVSLPKSRLSPEPRTKR